MKNIGNMMKQAQQMQAKMQEMQAGLDDVEKTGQSGAGMVTVTVNGKGEMKKIKLDKSIVDPEETEVLEDLIQAAFNDAKKKVEAHVAEETAKLMGGLKLPPASSCRSESQIRTIPSPPGERVCPLTRPAQPVDLSPGGRGGCAPP